MKPGEVTQAPRLSALTRRRWLLSARLRGVRRGERRCLLLTGEGQAPLHLRLLALKRPPLQLKAELAGAIVEGEGEALEVGERGGGGEGVHAARHTHSEGEVFSVTLTTGRRGRAVDLYLSPRHALELARQQERGVALCVHLRLKGEGAPLNAELKEGEVEAVPLAALLLGTAL
jgi:hypothetical protein